VVFIGFSVQLAYYSENNLTSFYMEDLKMKFKKEPVGRQRIVVAGLAGVVASFLPWWSISFGSFGSASVNGWHSYGMLTTIASLAIVLNWLLPKVGVKYNLPWKEEILLKIFSVAMLAGPVLWIIDTSFSFSMIGLGVYLALVAGGVAVYYSFAKTLPKATK